MRIPESPFLTAYADQDYQVDRAMLREPKLWMPGQKPTWQVRIDWSHPLTDKLTAYFILDPQRPIDIVTGQVGTLVNNASYSPSYSGIGLKTAYGTADKVTFPYHVNYNIANTAFTFAGKVFQTTNPVANVGLFSPSRSGAIFGGEYISYVTSAKQFVFQESASIAQTASNVWKSTTNVDISYGVTWDSSVYTKFYVNGIEYPDNNSNTDLHTTFDTSNGYTISNGGTDQSNGFGGTQYWHALWKRKLSVTEMKSLHNDPYQFLVPA